MPAVWIMCPRCRGSMCLEEDYYGEYYTCVSCGFVKEDNTAAAKIVAHEEVRWSGKQRRRYPRHGSIQL